jgi:hypothetical protein
MSLRFLAGTILLILACIAQIWLGWVGMPVNLALAALISFAFLFGFWELFAFVLAAIFLLNWQPGPSLESLMLVLLPLGAFCIHKLSYWQAWVGMLISVTVALILFYLIIAPALILSRFAMFFTDLISCIIFSAILFRAMNRRVGR